MILTMKSQLKKILIDNGHGCNTAGKRSPDGRFREYAWTRYIARAVVADIKDLGYNAQLLVPEEYDVSLSTRCYRVNCWCDELGKRNVDILQNPSGPVKTFFFRPDRTASVA